MTTPTARAKELVQAVDAVVRDRSSDFRPRIGYFDDLEAVLATALTAAANEAAQAERERCAKVLRDCAIHAGSLLERETWLTAADALGEPR